MMRLRFVLLPIILVVLTACMMISSAAFAQPGASNQDKAQACKDMADKRNLTGDDRKNFLQNCATKASEQSSGQGKAQQAANDKLDDMSQREKLNACENLADKKNLKGGDRRSYVKDCMQKANPK